MKPAYILLKGLRGQICKWHPSRMKNLLVTSISFVTNAAITDVSTLANLLLNKTPLSFLPASLLHLKHMRGINVLYNSCPACHDVSTTHQWVSLQSNSSCGMVQVYAQEYQACTGHNTYNMCISQSSLDHQFIALVYLQTISSVY